MQQVVPTLRITDDARSKAFYVEKLAFQIDWELRAMTVVDPDGNKLRICTRLEGWRR